MPYTVPTPAQFRTRFPVFAAESDERVQLFLDEASGKVDLTYVEADYQPAIMYAAAHLLATDGSNEGDDIEVGAQTGPISSESFGEISVSYRAPAGYASQSEWAAFWGTTEWGRRYLSLVRVNKGGAIVAI